MTSRGSTTTWSALIALTLSAAGCGVLLGLDEFKDAPEQAAQGSGGKEDPGTGGSGGTAGGADTAPICEPNTSERCYSGPAGTEDVGLCRAGTRTCESDGKAWGACEGEVPPRQESCASTEDENCDGFDCGLWARTFHVPDHKTTIRSMAIDTDKNIFAVGMFTGSIQLGGEPLIGAENNEADAYDAFIVSLDGDGNYRWGRHFSDAAHQEASSVCVDSAGNVIVAGVNSGTIKLGDNDIGPGIFVAKFDSDGNHLWSKGILGSSATGTAFHAGQPIVKTTSDGDVILAGSFIGTIQLDETRLSSYTADTHRSYVAKLDGDTGSSNAANGGWVQQLGAYGETRISAIDVYGNNIVITGHLTGGVLFGDFSLVIDNGMFLVNMDRNGKITWARGYANASPSALDIDTLGNISVAGAYKGPTDFGGGELPRTRQEDVFITQFDITGNHNWSRGFNWETKSPGISTDSLNNIVLVGTLTYSAIIDPNEKLEGRELPCPLIIKLDATGKTLWKRWFKVEPFGVGYANVTGVGPDNEIVVSGGASARLDEDTTIDFGCEPQRVEEYSQFIAKLGL